MLYVQERGGLMCSDADAMMACMRSLTSTPTAWQSLTPNALEDSLLLSPRVRPRP